MPSAFHDLKIIHLIILLELYKIIQQGLITTTPKTGICIQVYSLRFVTVISIIAFAICTYYHYREALVIITSLRLVYAVCN